MGRCVWRAWEQTFQTERFLKMGVDELSVSPGRVLALRDKIRKIKC